MRGARPWQGRTAARALGRVLLTLLVLTLALAACGFNKPDLRYRDSRLQDPLAVPADLAAPVQSPSMEIPTAGAAVPDAALPDGDGIEQPPDLRAGAQDSGRE